VSVGANKKSTGEMSNTETIKASEPTDRDRAPAYQGGAPVGDSRRQGALEVPVENGVHIEKAIKILKRKLIKEGLFKELKLRRYYEKPSERRKRKHKESVKKLRKEEARQKKNPFLFG